MAQIKHRDPRSVKVQTWIACRTDGIRDDASARAVGRHARIVDGKHASRRAENLPAPRGAPYDVLVVALAATTASKGLNHRSDHGG